MDFKTKLDDIRVMLLSVVVVVVKVLVMVVDLGRTGFYVTTLTPKAVIIIANSSKATSYFAVSDRMTAV